MAITQVTRRALVADLVAGRWSWSGDLDEPRFLARLYDLETLPSKDQRYENALGDIIQHTVANYDEEPDWVFGDERFGLADGDDHQFLRFLAESLHPEVRTDQAAAQTLVSMYNRHLRHDGWELYHQRSISGRPVYAWRAATVPRPTLRQLREAIAEAIRDNLTSYDVAEFCHDQLGLEPQRDEHDDPHYSKRGYVLERIKQKNEGELLTIARRVLAEFSNSPLSDLVAVLEVDDGGVAGDLKNLIFAANGPKPEIVLRDAINNVIEITRNAEYCLVYDRPLDDAGLAWRSLVAWWATTHPGENERAIALDLHRRLRQSLNPGPEQLILDTYAGLYREHGYDIPALIPQVYLHFDPLTQQQRGGPGPLPRQRMDFLLLLPKRRRVVIELDGQQHYSNDDGSASPRKYAEMVREDRALQLSGYEVFRIGGEELTDAAEGRAMLTQFFLRLLETHSVSLQP